MNNETCLCEENCRLNCPVGSDLDKELCECVWWVEPCDESIVCDSTKEINPLTCECECKLVRTCRNAARIWDSDTCACELHDCENSCTNRFTLDNETCECNCIKECTNERRPYLWEDVCKCKKSEQ
jgi:hypothetical protein